MLSLGPRLNLNKGNYIGLRKFLAEEWDKKFSDKDTVDEMWSEFCEILDDGIRRHIPFTEPGKKNSKWHYPVDKEYKTMVRRKHRLWTRWTEKQTVEAEQAYKKQRNLVRKESRRLERKQQCEVAKTCKTKPKKFWKYVRPKRENRGGIGDIKAKDQQGNEVTVTEGKEKAEMFAIYFSAVFTQESSESFRQLSAAKISVPMKDIHVTREQIEAKLK